jgi:hypothetical protein
MRNWKMIQQTVLDSGYIAELVEILKEPKYQETNDTSIFYSEREPRNE